LLPAAKCHSRRLRHIEVRSLQHEKLGVAYCIANADKLDWHQFPATLENLEQCRTDLEFLELSERNVSRLGEPILELADAVCQQSTDVANVSESDQLHVRVELLPYPTRQFYRMRYISKPNLLR
jgi:hypothetical protein